MNSNLQKIREEWQYCPYGDFQGDLEDCITMVPEQGLRMILIGVYLDVITEKTVYKPIKLHELKTWTCDDE